MDTKNTAIAVRPNDFWLSEIADIFFTHQIGYTCYSYSKNSWQEEEGYDLMVINKQTIPYYVVVYGNPNHDYLFLPMKELGVKSRLLYSKADFVLFYNVGGDKIFILDLEPLKDTIKKQCLEGSWKEKPILNKDGIEGLQIELDDPNIKPLIQTYKIRQPLIEKYKKIMAWKIDRAPVVAKKRPLPISRVGEYDIYR